MIHRHFLLVCATVGVFAVFSQSSGPARVPATRFTCQGRPSGYYADIDTGCQVYHMCDGLGRQFSYSCPNTTLFQQRMLICDHWYMVNCTNSESDYSANLLIGQRDKPFVSEADMRLRTPRPDILSVPLNNNYYDGLKEAESKYPVHPENSIVGIGDTISTANNNGLDGGKQNYRPPSSWSTGTSVNRPTNVRPRPNHNLDEEDNLKGSASQEPEPTYQPTPATTSFTKNTAAPNVTPPSQHLVPPFQPITTTEEPHNSDEFQIDARMKPANEDRVFNFIKRFDPNSPDSIKTSMTKEEIEKINQELPAGQSSAEEDRPPRKNKNTGNNFNFVRNDRNKEDKNKFSFEKGPSTEPITASDINTNVIPEPSRELLPPKRDFSNLNPTTMGPPIYYEWKWAVPAFGLEPPKLDNSTNATAITKTRQVTGRNPFDSVTRPTSTTVDVTPSNTEYNISSYFVPDYIFPLDKPHPGYENENAETSFQVKVGRESRANYGENPACPQCHPAYLKPGTCEPCIVNR